MKFCDKCGIKLEEDAKVCTNCKNSSLLDLDKERVSFSMSGNETVNTSVQELDVKTFIAMNQNENSKKHARLSVIKGGTEGREFPVNLDICNIGRWDPTLKSNPEIDLSDEDIDAKVSRLHARIIRKPEGYYIEDIGSRNGTFLNREFKLVEGIEYSLKDNDEIIIGHIFFKFQLI